MDYNYNVQQMKKYSQAMAMTWEKLLSLPVVAPQHLTLVPMMQQRTPIPDFSVYTYVAGLNLQGMFDNGVPAIITRSSFGSAGIDTNCEIIIAKARAIGLKVGVYHWVDPNQSISVQMNFFASLIEKYKPDFISLDCEQWWLSWDEWQSAINGTLLWSKVRIMPSSKISSQYKLACDTIQSKYPKLILFLYTGWWFVGQYSLEMATWLSKIRSWMASYTKPPFPAKTWGDFYSFMNGIREPNHSYGITETLLQFTSSQTDPQSNSNQLLDWSFYNGSSSDFIALISNSTPIPNPDPTPTPTPIPIPVPIPLPTYHIYKIKQPTKEITYANVHSNPDTLTTDIVAWCNSLQLLTAYAYDTGNILTAKFIRIDISKSLWVALSVLNLIK